jgi:hypothetical protein
MEKKYVSTEEENHTITITNKYDPNVDYYRERETRWQQKKIHLNKSQKKFQI